MVIRKRGYRIRTVNELELVEKVGNRIRSRMKAFRLSNGLSKAAINNLACFSGNSGWQRLEYGKDLNLGFFTLCQIASIMDISLNELISPLPDEIE